MPHKLRETRLRAEMMAQQPFGPGFVKADLHEVVRMEIWGSDYSEPGEDYCEYHLFDAQNRLRVSRRVRGY